MKFFVDICSLKPCEEGHLCVRGSHFEKGYSCTCPKGFSGDKCEKG